MTKYSYNYIIFFLVTLPFSFSITYSQTIIKGKVIDALSRQALNNVSIADLDGASRATTDEYGNFRLKINNQHRLCFLPMLATKPPLL
jgi:hypothetical protein